MIFHLSKFRFCEYNIYEETTFVDRFNKYEDLWVLD